MIAFCGLSCHECPAFLATFADDDTKRAETAELWSKNYDPNIRAEDINCDGCQTYTGRLFGHCRVCEIRRCGMKRDILNCAYCDEYACKKLTRLFLIASAAKNQLDEIRGELEILA
ncbi:MAG: DUF3795 domain-containing protein [Deltaproteobacteria bacterium]|nr:DUF3795 domain-containing protein [Deltaproteobacteria bacterium]